MTDSWPDNRIIDAMQQHSCVIGGATYVPLEVAIDVARQVRTTATADLGLLTADAEAEEEPEVEGESPASGQQSPVSSQQSREQSLLTTRLELEVAYLKAYHALVDFAKVDANGCSR